MYGKDAYVLHDNEPTDKLSQDTVDFLTTLGFDVVEFPSVGIECRKETHGDEVPVPKNTPNPKQAYGDKKIPMHLVPPASIAYEAMAMAEGARKYGAYNWRENDVEVMTYVGAAMRHLGQWVDGEEIDSDSGKPHLAHAKACLGILIDATENGNAIDNRPASGPMSKVLVGHETE